MNASSAAVAFHRRLGRKRLATSLLLLAALALSLALDVATGPAMLPLDQVAASLLGLPVAPRVDAIVHAIRLPIAVMAILVGAALGVSGAVMQTILNNPLASSYTLGISAAAGFGAALAILAGSQLPVPDEAAVPLCAFAFASLACAMVWGIGRLRGAGPETLVLGGIAVLFLFQALLSLAQVVASQEALPMIVFWLFGSLAKATWPKVVIVAAVLALCLPLLLRDCWGLTALRLGEDRAASLGVRPAVLRLRGFALVSLLTGAAVAFVGTIGFVGLVAPHIARMLVGEDQRFLLPASGLAGALLLSAASVVGKGAVPGAVLPVGVVTALIGVPFFAWLVLAQRRGHW